VGGWQEQKDFLIRARDCMIQGVKNTGIRAKPSTDERYKYSDWEHSVIPSLEAN
jgi:hypothetical protein